MFEDDVGSLGSVVLSILDKKVSKLVHGRLVHVLLGVHTLVLHHRYIETDVVYWIFKVDGTIIFISDLYNLKQGYMKEFSGFILHS